jgi:pectate lyase
LEIDPKQLNWTDPASNVAAAVGDLGCGAGATLKVTPYGAISAGVCDAVSDLETKNMETGINCYPNTVDKLLNIDFTHTESSYTSIDIYATNGNKVFSDTKNIASNAHIELNLSHLLSGEYFCTIKNDNSIVKQTFVKK